MENDDVLQMIEYLDDINNLNNINNINNLNNLQNLEFMNLIELEKGKYSVQKRFDPVEMYHDEDFERRFRMSKQSVRNLFHLIDGENTLDPMVVRGDFTISGISKLLIALRFYTVGSFFEATGDIFGVSQTIACQAVSEVSYLIASKLKNRYITMPSTDLEVNAAKAMFHRIAKFPLVIGAVDGTHIRVQSFGGRNAELYRNRKTYFSINCQIVVSANMEIIDVCCRWPGSSHDATIFANSALCAKMDHGEFGRQCVILGDSAYGAEYYVCKPLQIAVSNAEKKYQKAQIKTRNVAERTFGALKRMFPCLQLGLHLNLEKVQDVILTCCILYNMARIERQSNVRDPIEENEIYFQTEMSRHLRTAQRNQEFIRTQHFLIDEYFSLIN